MLVKLLEEYDRISVNYKDEFQKVDGKVTYVDASIASLVKFKIDSYPSIEFYYFKDADEGHFDSKIELIKMDHPLAVVTWKQYSKNGEILFVRTVESMECPSRIHIKIEFPDGRNTSFTLLSPEKIMSVLSVINLNAQTLSTPINIYRSCVMCGRYTRSLCPLCKTLFCLDCYVSDHIESHKSESVLHRI